MSFVAIIPARSASTRLPGKPLLDIAGKPMVVRTAEQAALSDASRVVIATDDPRIQDVVRQHGFDALLTRSDHPTGTDRLAEAAERLDLPPDTVVVNVQGDEPLIDPRLIDHVAQLLGDHPAASIATCATPIQTGDQLFNPNVVKVVCDHNGQALYFSRAPIPWARDEWAEGGRHLPSDSAALHHIGLYAYRTDFLLAYPKLLSGPLERLESLEQLRALENGFKIAVLVVPDHPAAGVDTAQDLQRVRDIFSNRL